MSIVFLNGTSSSGKSSIAACLLELLPTPYFHVPVDAINGMRSRPRTAELSGADLDAVLERTVLGYHRVIAGLAAAGNDVIADHVLRPHWLADCLDVLRGHDVTFVGVHCPLPELRRRESRRGDREPGQAERQFAVVHAHGDYDVECDTSAMTAEECARLVSDAVGTAGRPRAFDRLRASSR